MIKKNTLDLMWKKKAFDKLCSNIEKMNPFYVGDENIKRGFDY